MRPSSPRSSRISSTTARYSVSSSRTASPAGTSSGRSSASTNSRPCASVSAAPAIARWRPFSATAVSPPGSRTVSVTSATVPTLAYSPSCLGTSSTRSSSPTSTVRVTFMLGKTTMSSRGTSKSLLTVGSRSSADAVVIGHTITNYKNCSGIPQGRPSARQPCDSYGTRTNLGRRRRVSVRGVRFPPSPPGTGHRSCGRALRGRDRESMGARLRAPIVVPVRRRATQPAGTGVSRESPARSATRPASTSDEMPGAGRAIGHHGHDERAARPEDDPVVVASAVDPAGLVEHTHAGELPDLPVELAGVPHVSEQIEQVAGVRGGEARLGGAERAAAAAREPDGAQQAREVVGARLLAAPPARLAVDPQRNPPASAREGRRPPRARSRRTSPCRRARATASSSSRVPSRRTSSRRSSAPCRLRRRCRSTSASDAAAGRASIPAPVCPRCGRAR